MNTDIDCGALNRARINGEKGLQWIEEWSYVKGFKRRPTRMLAQLRVEMGRLHYEWNDLEQAARYWNKACKYFELVGSYHRVTAYLYLVDLHQALGKNEKALHYLAKVKRIRTAGEFSIRVKLLDPQIASRNLLLNQFPSQRTYLLAEAEEWAQHSDLKPDDKFRYEQEYEYLTLARVFIAGNKAGQAVSLMDRLISSAEGAGRNGQLITYLAVQALTHHCLGNTDKALSHLSRALTLAEPEGYIRTFVDLGLSMWELLHLAVGRGMAPAYVSTLLAAFPTRPLPGRDIRSSPRSPIPEMLVEPLTDREVQILRLMAVQRLFQEIADELYLSVNTVKWYAKNIYGKLGVNSKADAVARVWELGLI
jgi:LuxR family maltose regulon positive regulatory protein